MWMFGPATANTETTQAKHCTRIAPEGVQGGQIACAVGALHLGFPKSTHTSGHSLTETKAGTPKPLTLALVEFP